MTSLFFSIFIIALFSSRGALGNIWRTDDALILENDAEINDDIGVETTTGFPAESNTDTDFGDCLTSEGVTGTCMKFEDCYSYLNESFSHTSFLQELTEIVRNISTPCTIQEDSTLKLSPGGESALETEGAVCCATLSRTALNKNVPEYPKELPNFLDDVSMQSFITERSSGCGESAYTLTDTNPAIINPVPATLGEFPWLVALFNHGKPHCAGSLLDSQTVVTAAHCVNHIKKGGLKDLTLSIGDHDIFTKTEVKNEKRSVKRLIFHNKFNMQSFQDDIALIILNQPVKFSSTIKPVCLNTKYTDLTTGIRTGTIAGWGKTTAQGHGSRSVQKADNIKIWTNPQCNTRYAAAGPGIPRITTKMMCAGSDGKDSCQGDSGGPLTIYADGKHLLAGIVSWGVNCGEYPGVYTRVDKYMSWITKYWH